MMLTSPPDFDAALFKLLANSPDTMESLRSAAGALLRWRLDVEIQGGVERQTHALYISVSEAVADNCNPP